jgi:hypothetical protein
MYINPWKVEWNRSYWSIPRCNAFALVAQRTDGGKVCQLILGSFPQCFNQDYRSMTDRLIQNLRAHISGFSQHKPSDMKVSFECLVFARGYGTHMEYGHLSFKP